MESNKTKFACYFRVSTKSQGDSGLGLEAQKATCNAYIKSVGGTCLKEFMDIESGKSTTRQGLFDAIEFCKANDCTLVISKLDRFSRDIEFTFKVINTGISIYFCDMPVVNTMILGVFASVAQYERELISKRTKDGLTQSRAKGIKAGMANENYKGNKVEILKEANKASIKANKLKAENNDNNKKFISICSLMNITANSDFKEIANELNRRGCRTSTGKELSNLNARQMWQRYSAQIREFKNN